MINLKNLTLTLTLCVEVIHLFDFLKSRGIIKVVKFYNSVAPKGQEEKDMRIFGRILRWEQAVLLLTVLLAVVFIIAGTLRGRSQREKTEESEPKLTLEERVAALEKRVPDGAGYTMPRVWDKLEELDGYDKSLSERFGSVENRLGNLGTRVDKVSKRLARLEARSVDLRVRSRRRWSVSSRFPYPPSGRIWPLEPVTIEKISETGRQDTWSIEGVAPTKAPREEAPSMEVKLP